MTRFSTLSLLVAASLVTASVAPAFAQTAPAATPPAASAAPAATKAMPPKPLTAEGLKRQECNAKWKAEKIRTKAKGWKPYYTYMANCL